jgi:sugar phosphate isomerase/epimerase
MSEQPPISICEFTTVAASFAEDLRAYASAGAEGIGICEFKLGDDGADLARLRESGLRATHCVPAVPSILPLPLLEGPSEPAERVEAICRSIRRLAPFEPVCCLFLTGPPGERGENAARRTVAEGIEAIAAEAERAGVVVALEPIQREFARFWTLVSTVRDAVALLEEAGRPELPILFDTWHLWNDERLFDDIDRHAARFAGVHVADWRAETRNTNDRVFPGEGVAGLPRVLAALETAGYRGWYDVEIFSDTALDGSLWQLEAADAAQRAVGGVESVWAARGRS